MKQNSMRVFPPIAFANLENIGELLLPDSFRAVDAVAVCHYGFGHASPESTNMPRV